MRPLLAVSCGGNLRGCGGSLSSRRRYCFRRQAPSHRDTTYASVPRRRVRSALPFPASSRGPGTSCVPLISRISSATIRRLCLRRSDLVEHRSSVSRRSQRGLSAPFSTFLPIARRLFSIVSRSTFPKGTSRVRTARCLPSTHTGCKEFVRNARVPYPGGSNEAVHPRCNYRLVCLRGRGCRAARAAAHRSVDDYRRAGHIMERPQQPEIRVGRRRARA